MKNVATQKETNAAGPDNRSKIVLLVDASQQTGKARFLTYIHYRFFKKFIFLREFPGRAVVRVPRFHCRGHGFDPWLGIPHATWQGQKIKFYFIEV